MKRRAAGHIIFVGATASRRGGAKTAAFASARAAQRSLAESLARSLGPSKIHVSLIIIDGIVDEPSIRTKLADKLDSFCAGFSDAGIDKASHALVRSASEKRQGTK